MGINHLEELPVIDELGFKPKKANYFRKDRRRWESINTAHAGVASRRKAEELIKQGLVTVNGQVVRELATTIKSGDKVEVEGQPIYNEEKVYYLLNKPRGVISSVTDDKGRKLLSTSYLNVKERIYPVGRLDWDTSGVLILTTMGILLMKWFTLVMRLTRSMSRVLKGWPIRIIGSPWTRGLEIDGKKTKPAVYEILKVDPVEKPLSGAVDYPWRA